jgi:hypothetical protein
MEQDEGERTLRKAKELLETRGWVQGEQLHVSVIDYNKAPVCAFTSVFVALDELYPNVSSTRVRANHGAFNRLLHVIGLKLISEILPWNDAEERKKEEVLEVFDRAIALRPPY